MLQHKSFYKIMTQNSDNFQLSITAEIQALKDRCSCLERQTKDLQSSLDAANTENSGLQERLLDWEEKFCRLSRENDQKFQKLSNQIFMANSNIESIVESVILLYTESEESEIEDNANFSSDLESFVYLVDENQMLQNIPENDQKDKVQEVAVDEHVVENKHADYEVQEQVLLKKVDEIVVIQAEYQANEHANADMKEEMKVLLENEDVKAAEKTNLEEKKANQAQEEAEAEIIDFCLTSMELELQEIAYENQTHSDTNVLIENELKDYDVKEGAAFKTEDTVFDSNLVEGEMNNFEFLGVLTCRSFELCSALHLQN
jgi:hypothetical protein